MEVKTIVVQIGNSDDRLSQVEWSQYVNAIKRMVDTYSEEIHFSGGPTTVAKWQNFCWVFTIKETKIEHLIGAIKRLRESYDQESVALIVGDTEFI